MFHFRFGVLICLLITPLWGVADPIVIAHRGASGYLPEHTLEAVALAHAQGADYIEQDIVLSKDNVPVVLHDIHLDTTTNVAEVFPNRQREDGRYYAIDFTLEQLKTLRVHERKSLKGKQVFPQRYQGNAAFSIATLEEEIELIKQLNRQTGTDAGFYPEIKSPAWHRAQGKDISAIVLDVLRRHQLDSATAPIYIQCFDFEEVKRLRLSLGLKAKLVQLIAENSWQESNTDYDRLKTPDGLKEIAKYAQGIGPWIPQLVTFDKGKAQISSLSGNAKQHGLTIHPYTHRVDSLPKGVTSQQLLNTLFNQVGVDGIFSDFPNRARIDVIEISDN